MRAISRSQMSCGSSQDSFTLPAEKEPEVAAAEAAPEITEPEVLKKGKAATEEEGEEKEKEKEKEK